MLHDRPSPFLSGALKQLYITKIVNQQAFTYIIPDLHEDGAESAAVVNVETLCQLIVNF